MKADIFRNKQVEVRVLVRVVENSELDGSDLIVDAVYQGAPGGAISREPIATLLRGIGNPGWISVFWHRSRQTINRAVHERGRTGLAGSAGYGHGAIFLLRRQQEAWTSAP